MWSMGANNWIKYGWGKEMTTNRRNDGLIVDVSNGELPIKKMLPIDAACDAVKQITEEYPGPYTLMCSGGIDSQAMIYAWHKANVPFSIVSFKYVSNNIVFNDYDLAQLTEFTDKLGLPVEFKTLDLISFLENELPEVAVAMDCDSPQINALIQVAQTVTEGTTIFSGNFICGNLIGFNYTILGLHRYAIKQNVSCVPFFFVHTPELAYSLTPYNTDLENYGNNYLAAGFPIIKQAQKYNGFEKVKDFYDSYSKEIPLPLRMNAMNKPSRRIFDILFRYPYSGVAESLPPLLLTKEKNDQIYN